MAEADKKRRDLEFLYLKTQDPRLYAMLEGSSKEDTTLSKRQPKVLVGKYTEMSHFRQPGGEKDMISISYPKTMTVQPVI